MFIESLIGQVLWEESHEHYLIDSHNNNEKVT